MFFSRVQIEYGNLAQIKLIRILQGDMYGVHSLIWQLFPNDPAAKRDFIFRQEFEKEQLAFSVTRRGIPLFYIVSRRKPEPVSDLLIVESKEYYPRLTIGMRLAFKLRANPVVQQKCDRQNSEEWHEFRKKSGMQNKETTKIRRYHDVLMDAKMQIKQKGISDRSQIQIEMNNAALQWLSAKSQSNGFELERLNDELNVNAFAYKQHLLGRKGKAKPIKFSSVDYSGTLIVTNVDFFQNVLYNGLGHSKAFGCGLLLIRRV